MIFLELLCVCVLFILMRNFVIQKRTDGRSNGPLQSKNKPNRIISLPCSRLRNPILSRFTQNRANNSQIYRYIRIHICLSNEYVYMCIYLHISDARSDSDQFQVNLSKVHFFAHEHPLKIQGAIHHSKRYHGDLWNKPYFP